MTALATTTVKAATTHAPAEAGSGAPTCGAVFDRKALLAALRHVGKIAPRKCPKPVLECCRLSLSGSSGATLSATNLEATIALHVAGAEVTRPGVTLIPVAALAKLCRESIDPTLWVESDGKTLLVRGARSRVSLVLEHNLQDYPAPPVLEWDGVAETTAGTLCDGLAFCLPATDDESTRYALGAVKLEAEAGRLRMVATDGRRLHQFETDAETSDAWDASAMVLLPGPIGKLAAAILAKRSGDDVSIVWAGGQVVISAEGVTLSSRTLEGRYPRWQDVVPKRTEKLDYSTGAGSLLSVVKAAQQGTSIESRGADFDFTADALTISASAVDVGQSSASLPVESGQPGGVSITLDPAFVVDILKPLNKAADVAIELVDADHAALFRSGDRAAERLAVLMPLARDRD